MAIKAQQILIIKNQGQDGNFTVEYTYEGNALTQENTPSDGYWKVEDLYGIDVFKVLEFNGRENAYAEWNTVKLRDDSSGSTGSLISPSSPNDLKNKLLAFKFLRPYSPDTDGGVQSVTGSAVDNTDPQNPVINSTGGYDSLQQMHDADPAKTTITDGTNTMHLEPVNIYIETDIEHSGTAPSVGVLDPTKEAFAGAFMEYVDGTVNSIVEAKAPLSIGSSASLRGDGSIFQVNESGGSVTTKVDNITDNREHQRPDGNGTYGLGVTVGGVDYPFNADGYTDDIPSGGGGSGGVENPMTEDLDGGGHYISNVENLQINDTANIEMLVVGNNAGVGGDLTVTGAASASNLSGTNTGDNAANSNTGLVHTSGTETIAGAKTFSSTIAGSISGNAATVTTNANLTGAVTSSGNATTYAGVLPSSLGGTGTTSLGSGVSTFLTTPSSANAAAMFTDKTGTNKIVFSDAPTLVNPVVGTQAVTDNSTKAASTAWAAPRESFMALTSDYTFPVSLTDLQKIFNVPANGAFDAVANSTYKFELNVSAIIAGTNDLKFGILGTANITSIKYTSIATKGVNLANGVTRTVQTTSATQIASSSQTTTARTTITGIIRVTTAGTIIPAFGFGIAAAPTIDKDSYCIFTRLGSDTVTNSPDVN